MCRNRFNSGRQTQKSPRLNVKSGATTSFISFLLRMTRAFPRFICRLKPYRRSRLRSELGRKDAMHKLFCALEVLVLSVLIGMAADYQVLIRNGMIYDG